MNITISPEQQKWLETEVAAGHFDSIDDAVAAAIGQLMSLNDDDLAWAKPYIEQARASVARGEAISGDEFFKRLARKLEILQSP
jgi:antitoxin ParD1/3/4